MLYPIDNIEVTAAFHDLSASMINAPEDGWIETDSLKDIARLVVTPTGTWVVELHCGPRTVRIGEVSTHPVKAVRTVDAINAATAELSRDGRARVTLPDGTAFRNRNLQAAYMLALSHAHDNAPCV